MKKFLVLLLLWPVAGWSADSVDVTFRYIISGSPTGVSVPGEFNSWNNTAWPMTNAGGTLWVRNARLAIGGNPTPGGIPGAWQYKFYYNGVSQWPNDPLNHHVNAADNGNSFIYTKDPTIYHLLPNQRSPLVSTSAPTISAYIYPKVGGVLDTASLALNIDGAVYSGLGQFYDSVTKQLSFTAPPLVDGSHLVILTAGTNADTVTFTTQGGFVRLLNRSPFSTWKTSWTLNGLVDDTAASSVKLVRNSIDTFTVPVAARSFSYTASLLDGANTFFVIADSSGTEKVSSPISIHRIVNHAPLAVVSFDSSVGQINLLASSSSDPDSNESSRLSFLWGVNPGNPAVILGIEGSALPSISISPPAAAGEYYFSLIAADPAGNRDTTRNYFTIDASGKAIFPSPATNPSWVKEGRMYLLYFKSATPQGTINAALPRLDYIASMGYNIIWIMPVMKNAFPMSNLQPGYDIADFYTVAPEYGTNDDFKNFVAQAHQLGLKIILDVTPNHTSAHHPFVADIRAYRQNSPYWNFYQHQMISNPNYHPNITESLTSDSLFVYYSGYSDELLNYNWTDLDARNYMIDAYKWWVREMGVDGYRLDSYWGPARRANNGNGGENEMGYPVRTALKHIKPDIFLLAEDDATGIGTQTKFSDQGGGVDAAYDWNLFHNAIQSFYGPIPLTSAMNTYLLNFGGTSMGFMPGPDAYFMRFLEDQDEERIVHQYGSQTKPMPVSTCVLLSVGIPLVYSGQEVGWGTGISDYDQRRRGVIDWNNAGRSLLLPHYQKLAQIRKQFPPFWSQQQMVISTGNSFVLGYTRPMDDLNGIILANVDSLAHTASLTLSGVVSPNVYFTNGAVDGRTYHASDLYNDTVYSIVFTAGTAQLVVNLGPYASSVLVLAESTYSLTLPPVLGVRESAAGIPGQFSLYQNYPNPFNPVTEIDFDISKAGQVSLKVYDLLGRLMTTLVEGRRGPGRYHAVWDASSFSGLRGGAPSGVYLYRLTTPSYHETRKMLLIR